MLTDTAHLVMLYMFITRKSNNSGSIYYNLSSHNDIDVKMIIFELFAFYIEVVTLVYSVSEVYTAFRISNSNSYTVCF